MSIFWLPNDYYDYRNLSVSGVFPIRLIIVYYLFIFPRFEIYIYGWNLCYETCLIHNIMSFSCTGNVYVLGQLAAQRLASGTEFLHMRSHPI